MSRQPSPVTILTGDCRDVLATLPAGEFHMCVTSPPYFGLRDYHGGAAEIGLEPTPDEFVAALVAVFREVRRVLRDDGTVWLNLGSSFCSKPIQSQRYVIRRGLPNAERVKVAKALSEVWSGHASPESAVQGLLDGSACKARELSQSAVREMRSAVSRSPIAGGCGERPVLLAELRTVGQPDAEAGAGSLELQDVRETAGAISCGHEEEPGEAGVLQPGMLVQLQPEGQPLSLVGRAARPDKSGRSGLAEGGIEAGQVSLPSVPCMPETGGASHPAVQESQGGAVGCEQRHHALPGVPQEDRAGRDQARRDTKHHSVHPHHGLENLAFDRDSIPSALLPWCEPEFIVKAKDDLGIPWMVAFALRADGWYLRQDIIWAKKNPMPESVRDRCTKAHEYVFLLSKSPRYYFDAKAIQEPASYPEGAGNTRGYEVANQRPGENANLGGGLHKIGPRETRNKRSVWTVASQPYSGAHFATFPPDLIEPCILAGCPAECCATCGAPWERDMEVESRPNNRPTGQKHDGTYYAANPGGGVANDRRNKIDRGFAPTCSCNAGTAPGRVLDPFGGSGTTALVARNLTRAATLIELNPTYAAQARERVHGPLFAGAAE